MEIHSSVPSPPAQLLESVQTLPFSDAPEATGLLIEEKQIALPIDTGSVCSTQPPTPSALWQSRKVFFSTFVTIFLAELGDKTQVSTLLMSAEFHAPWVVFTGAALALITTSLLGVWVGCWLSNRLTPKTLDTAAGITLALISFWLVLDVVQM